MPSARCPAHHGLFNSLDIGPRYKGMQTWTLCNNNNECVKIPVDTRLQSWNTPLLPDNTCEQIMNLYTDTSNHN